VAGFERLFEYNAWANDAAAAAVAAAGSPPPRAVAVVAHIVGAEWVWWARLHGVAPRFAVWPALSVDESVLELRDLTASWSRYIPPLGMEALSRQVTYTNSRGEAWTSSVEDVLTHVVLHSAYHRGQVAMALRGGGHDPAYTDYIQAVRQGLIE
jgi:uncharacterized damage-inducible protein DinB